MGMDIRKDSVDLGIVTTNGEEMLAFYRDVLGLDHVADSPVPGGGTMHRLMCGTSLIKLVVPDRDPGNPPAPGGLAGGTGYRYWTVTVGNLGEVVAAARQAGRTVPIDRLNVREGVDIAMIEDPDGNWVELLESD